MTGIIIKRNMETKTQLKHSNKSGFTLIELVIVMAIFLFVIGSAIFISVVQHQKLILNEQQLISQVSYAQEYMSKALRMAATETNQNCLTGGTGTADYIYLLTHNNSGEYQGIKFLNQSDEDAIGNPQCEEFFFERADPTLSDAVCANSTNLNCRTVLKVIKYDSDGNAGPTVFLTSKELQIDAGRFIVNGQTDQTSCISPCGASNDSADNGFVTQPRVTIMIQARIPDQTQPERIFETTVSQRNINAK